MAIDIFGCILATAGKDYVDWDSLYQWWLEYLFSLGWDGRTTV